eukprot:1596905-Rhodomonas_salina.1
MVRVFQSIGWNRVAIIHVNDAWGRGFAQDATVAAREAGIEIAISVGFGLGDRSGTEDAIGQISQSGARVTLCAVFQSDLAAVASVADEQGMIGTGYAWVIAGYTSIDGVLDQIPDPASTLARLTGWFIGSIDLLHGERGTQFDTALQQEPLGNLNHSGLEDVVSVKGIQGGRCHQPCALIYDAVWSAAIALGRVG